jgi:hypothetical protein
MLSGVPRINAFKLNGKEAKHFDVKYQVYKGQRKSHTIFMVHLNTTKLFCINDNEIVYNT